MCREKEREREKTTVKNAFGSQIYIYLHGKVLICSRLGRDLSHGLK